MPPLPELIITLLAPFAPLFTRPVWAHAQVLLLGAILCRGPRTVASVLRVMSLSEERRFEKYHRMLSRARWSGEDIAGFADHDVARERADSDRCG